MKNTWQPQGSIAAGGTIQGIAAGPAGIWLATEAGIWGGTASAWQPVEDAAPLPQTTALISAGGWLFAGGAPSGIAYSAGGRSWQAAWVDEADSPVTCFAISPRLADDGVLLAGTAGSGILRSTDGGRRWRLANFGLHEFDILALATTPDWGERELAFAATIGGVYRSPNGGRAWKRIAELDSAPIQVLAVSPRFAQDRTLYAAGEESALFRSADTGRTWQALALPDDRPAAFNALWIHPDDPALLVAGTPDGQIFRSTDRGEGWACVIEGLNPILALAGDAATLYAGLYDDGLLLSDDGGASWRNDSSLAARDITRLLGDAGVAAQHAYGPTGGLWRAADAGWQRIDGFESDGVLASAVAAGPRWLLAAVEGGLFRSDDCGASWEPAPPPSEAQILTLAAGSAPGEVLAGDAEGVLWRSGDGGLGWARAATVAAGLSLVALAQAGMGLPIAATYDSALGRAAVWRSGDGGRSWASWLEQPTTWPRVSICLDTEPRTENLYGGLSVAALPQSRESYAGTLIAIGAQVWRWDGERWRSAEVDGRPVAALLRLPGGVSFVAATAGGAYRSADGAGWQPLGADTPRGLVDLALAGDGRLLGLARGGRLWSLDLNEDRG